MALYQNEELVSIICNSIRKKLENCPRVVSENEYNVWNATHSNSFVHAGYCTIWDGFEIPSGMSSVVIIKKGRSNDYLIFESCERYETYRKAVNELGVSAFSLIEQQWLGNSLLSAIQTNSWSSSAYDKAQHMYETKIGLYFEFDVDKVENFENVISALAKYIYNMTPSVMAAVGKSEGKITYVENHEFDNYVELAFDVRCSDNIYLTKQRAFEVIYDKLMSLVSNVNADSRYDIKRNLLPKIVSSKKATEAFILSYLPKLQTRKSIWRPIVLAWQMIYSNKNGVQYLGNPLFFKECKDMKISFLYNEEVKFVGSQNSFPSVSQSIREGNIGEYKISDCISDEIQVGKALSKELKCSETLYAIAASLTEAASNQTENNFEQSKMEQGGI